MSNESLIAISSSIVAAAVSISWMLMHCTLVFGLSRAKVSTSDERIVWRCQRKRDAA